MVRLLAYRALFQVNALLWYLLTVVICSEKKLQKNNMMLLNNVNSYTIMLCK